MKGRAIRLSLGSLGRRLLVEQLIGLPVLLGGSDWEEGCSVERSADPRVVKLGRRMPGEEGRTASKTKQFS